MQSRWLTGPVVAGAVLGSIFLACGAQPGDETGAPGATSEPTADVEPLAVIPIPRARPLRANGLPAGVKPFRPRVAPAIDVLPGDVTDDAGGRFHDQVTPTCNNPKLTYFDGPLLQSPVIVPVFWSNSVNAALTAPITGMAQFFADVTQSSYWGWLQEYDTVGLAGGSEQSILGATATAGVILTPSRCGGPMNCTVSDAQIQTELNAQIASGMLPVPTLDCTGNTNTVYMIEFPPNVKVTGPDGAGTSCVQFCAYHNTGTYTGAGASSGKPLVYGVLMDEFTSACKTGCGANVTPLENATDTASHELVEAVTDPDIGLDTQNNYAAPAAWGDNQCGEIADICDTDGVGDTITVSGRTWSVQELWSNTQGKCASTGSDLPVCSGTTLTGCRKCSCGDSARACAGGTAVCETTATNVLFGACEQCTSTASTACGATGACAQSATPASDDICSCVPLTSCPAGDDCGTVSNGCGGTLSCGACTAPRTCGGGTPVNPNQCGCTPATSCPAGRNCGTASDGCGGNIACGTCASPQTCGGSGTAGTCGCTPATTCPAGQTCGTATNGCGGSLDCGTCTGLQTCGGGGTANQCGCTPLLVCPPGINCGTVPDGCGGVVSCGACSGAETCGGGGAAGVCGCTPMGCLAGDNCGIESDRCGGTVVCGTCAAPQTCGGGTPSHPNQCGCTPLAACGPGQACGTIADGCGGTLVCGSCSAGQTCNGTNQCVTTVVDAGHDSGSTADASADASRVTDGSSDAAGDAALADASAGDAQTGHDSGVADARVGDDSGTTDAGHAKDAGAKHDAGNADTGTVADGGSPQGDAGPDGGNGDVGASGGCSCRTAPTTPGSSPSGWLALVPLAFVVRRRPRRRGRETAA